MVAHTSVRIRRLGSWLALTTVVAAVLVASAQASSFAAGELIQRVHTNAARHAPGATATITVEIDNQTGSSWQGTL